MRIQPIAETNVIMRDIPMVDQTNLGKFEKIAIRCLIKKLDWRLLPYMLLIEIGSYINRISIGR